MESIDETLTADIHFAQVPHWVILLPLSDKALRLYTVLSKYADNADGTSYPGRGTLAKLMHCHRTSVDRAVEELMAAGCISKQVRVKDGRYTSSLYTVHRIPPRSTDAPSSTHATTPRRTHATTPSHPCDIELEPLNVEPELTIAPASQTKKETAPKRDELFEIVAEACNIDWTELTKTGRGQLNSATKELKEIGVTPEQVAPKAAAYRKRYPDLTLTPSALVKHWAGLQGGQVRRPNGRPQCDYCHQYLDDHEPQVCERLGGFR